MKLDSAIFDSIRVKSDKSTTGTNSLKCEWYGCTAPSVHLAPKGRNKGCGHWRFCLKHAKAYNSSYDYFVGMSDDQVKAFQKSVVTGHRVTQPLGSHLQSERGSFTGEATLRGGAWFRARFEFAHKHRKGGLNRDVENSRGYVRRRTTIRNAERRSLEIMNLQVHATAAEIRARFKELAKRHHPDLNGGDRSQEQHLQEVVEAYNYLKSVELC